jgi:glycyl-tRNA synthetase beta chain
MKNEYKVLIELFTEELPYTNIDLLSNLFKKKLLKNLNDKNILIETFEFFFTFRRFLIFFKFNSSSLKYDLIKKIKIVIEESVYNFDKINSMRWSDNLKSFLRPLKSYIFVINNKVINHKIFNIYSSNITYVKNVKKTELNFDNYKSKLNKLITYDNNKRFNLINRKLFNLAKKYNIHIILNKNSIVYLNNLLEYPYIIFSEFDNKYLKLPNNVIIEVVHSQNVCFPFIKDGVISNKFIIFTDGIYKNKNNIISGYKYFFNTKFSDILSLIKLDKNFQFKFKHFSNIVFHENLGNYYNKIKRVSHLILFLSEKLKINKSKLIKSFLISKISMFNRLSNYMPNINNILLCNNKKLDNIRYNIIILAEKIDIICGFFLLNKDPTGSKDPYNLKKEAIIINKIIVDNEIDINLNHIIKKSLLEYNNYNKKLELNIKKFILKRLIDKNSIILKNKSNLTYNEDNVLNLIRQTNLIERFSKYKFLLNIQKIYLRLKNITKDTYYYKKLKKNYLICKEEILLYKNLKYFIKINKILYKNNMHFERIKTFNIFKKNIDKFFSNVLVICDNNDLMTNRIKLLSIIKFLYKKFKISNID